jgi:hypothetical protein
MCEATRDVETLDGANEPLLLTLICDRDDAHIVHHDPDRGDWAASDVPVEPSQAVPAVGGSGG